MKNLFVADLRGVELSDTQRKNIETAIQDIVLKELNSGVRAGGKRSEANWALHIPLDWRGIWLNPNEPFPQLKVDDIAGLSK
jgi:hypothetical protein